MDTVQSKHSLDDIIKIKKIISKSELLVRSNPIHSGSRVEIDTIIKNGADIVMLPYFKTVEEVRRFLGAVDGCAQTNLLGETPESVEKLDDILGLNGIDEVHIGINDLHLGYHRKFMFELLADGTVEEICSKLKKKNMRYGFGGIAALGSGALPAERIIREHYRLGSTMAIVSRSFCNTAKITDREKIRQIFDTGISDIRKYEEEVQRHWDYFEQNQIEIKRIVRKIVGEN